VATNTVADRVVGMVLTAFAGLGEPLGLAEPCYGSPPYMAVVSGWDRRRDRPFIGQLVSGTAGGPGSPVSDGWLMQLLAGAAGVLYLDSVELVEQKDPLIFWERGIRRDSEGAGTQRGAPGNVCTYGPRFDPMDAHYFLDAVENRPFGVQGGGMALGPEVWQAHVDGAWSQRRETIGMAEIPAGDALISLSAGGGGFGDPLERDPARVLEDVIEDWISVERAAAVYGVVLAGDAERWETLSVDSDATARERSRLRDQRVDDEARAPFAQSDWWSGARIDGGMGR
jgi:N-methylhydantoinase B